MGLWSGFKDNILNPIRDKAKEYGERFKEDHPRFKATWKFLTHPTMVRVYTIAGALALAPFTGGFSLIVAVKVAVTFGTSLISIAAKAKQLRDFRRLKFQRNLAGHVMGKYADIMGTEQGKHLIKMLGKDKLQSHAAKTESKTTSFLKTLGYFGAENIAPVVMTAITSPAAALWYVVGIVGGASFISGEFKERTKMQNDSVMLKAQIMGARNTLGMTQNSVEFNKETFKNEMIKCKVMKKMCDRYNLKSMSPDEIRRKYNAELKRETDRAELEPIAREPNLARSFWHELRPWGNKEASYDNIDYENLVSYKPEPPTIVEMPKMKKEAVRGPDITPIQHKQKTGPKNKFNIKIQ